jgi:hypothetical protein
MLPRWIKNARYERVEEEDGGLKEPKQNLSAVACDFSHARSWMPFALYLVLAFMLGGFSATFALPVLENRYGQGSYETGFATEIGISYVFYSNHAFLTLL